MSPSRKLKTQRNDLRVSLNTTNDRASVSVAQQTLILLIFSKLYYGKSVKNDIYAENQ